MSESGPTNPCVEKTIALVFEIFRGITREGGVSWSESYVVDAFGSEEECLKARLQDKESGWEEVANDPDWEPFPGLGGFSFLDPIGLRYYLPAAIVKALRGYEEFAGALDSILTLSKWFLRSHTLTQWSKLQPAEIQCVCEFLKCMDLVESELDSPFYTRGEAPVTSWKHAYRSHWVKLDANPVSE